MEPHQSFTCFYVVSNNLGHVLDQIVIHAQIHHFRLQLSPSPNLIQRALHGLFEFLVLLYQRCDLLLLRRDHFLQISFFLLQSGNPALIKLLKLVHVLVRDSLVLFLGLLLGDLVLDFVLVDLSLHYVDLLL